MDAEFPDVHVEETSSSSQIPDSSFSNKQTLHCSLSRADNHLPKSPHKKAENIQRLPTKYQLRINLKEKCGRPRKDLGQEEKIWLVEFLDRADISYTNSGQKDHVYIGRIGEESQSKQKRYLLWPIREVLSMANPDAYDSFNSKFGKKLTFSQLYDFLKAHKEYVYHTNIPHASCLCEICENTSLLTKGLNKFKK